MLGFDPLFDIAQSTMGDADRKVPRSRHCTSCAQCSALIVQCMEMFLYIYSSQKFWCAFFWWDLPPGSSLSAFCFSMVIWNDWKWKPSHQEQMCKSGNWTEHYDWSAGLKHKCQFAMVQPTPQTWKRHMHNWLLAHLMPRWDQNFGGGGWYNHECSSLVQCTQVNYDKNIVVGSFVPRMFYFQSTFGQCECHQSLGFHKNYGFSDCTYRWDVQEEHWLQTIWTTFSKSISCWKSSQKRQTLKSSLKSLSFKVNLEKAGACQNVWDLLSIWRKLLWPPKGFE